MDNGIHRPLKIIAFNANGIMKQRYELSKQLQDLHVDVALLSETHLKPHERFYQITTFIEPTATRVEKAELPLWLDKSGNLIECRPTKPCFRRSDRGLHTYW
jgi:hypothetical protein